MRIAETKTHSQRIVYESGVRYVIVNYEVEDDIFDLNDYSGIRGCITDMTVDDMLFIGAVGKKLQNLIKGEK